jgi:hypothetical protein
MIDTYKIASRLVLKLHTKIKINDFLSFCLCKGAVYKGRLAAFLWRGPTPTPPFVRLLFFHTNFKLFDPSPPRKTSFVNSSKVGAPKKNLKHCWLVIR